MKDIQLYPHDAEYAIAHDELQQYRLSYRADIACKNAIDQAIRDNFDGAHLNPKAITEVVEGFGSERVARVLANTIQQKSWDGRFSRANKEWAATIPVPGTIREGFDNRDQFTAQSHTAILDGYTATFRREHIRQQDKPSVMTSIKQEHPNVTKKNTTVEPER